MNLSLAHSELDRLFDIFNKEKFDSKLEKPIIIIQSTGKKPINGYCTLGKLWSSSEDDRSLYEVGISAEHLSRDTYGIVATLLHEMVHLNNIHLGIKDCAPNFIYHNKKFKESAEAIGLIIEKAPKVGWSVTSLSEELKQFVDTLNVDSKAFSFYRQVPFKPKIENKYKQYKFVCPDCGEIVYCRNKQAELVCAKCSAFSERDFSYMNIEEKE